MRSRACSWSPPPETPKSEISESTSACDGDGSRELGSNCIVGISFGRRPASPSQQLVGDLSARRRRIFFARERAAMGGRGGRLRRPAPEAGYEIERRAPRRRGRVARRGQGVAPDAERDPPHLPGQSRQGPPAGRAVHRDERGLQLFGQRREPGEAPSLAGRRERRGLRPAGVEQAREHDADRDLRVAGRALAPRLHQRHGPLFADEDGPRIDVAPARVGVLGDLEHEVAGELGRERDAAGADDGEDFVERDRRVERAAAVMPRAPRRRRGVPAPPSARGTRFASAIVQVPSWKMVAASTALARPSTSPARRCSGEPTPPLAMTGTETASDTARVSARS